MVIYQLKRGDEYVEVTEGREERRDQLIGAGYVWLNEPKQEMIEASSFTDKEPVGIPGLKTPTPAFDPQEFALKSDVTDLEDKPKG